MMKIILKKNLKLYKKLPINDQRVFTLVRKFIKGQYSVLTQQKETIIDENLLSKNEKDISSKLTMIIKDRKYLSVYKKLKQKFNEYKKLIEEYNKISILCNRYRGSDEYQSINEKLKTLTNRLIFSLIELKVNLGLDLQDIAISDIIFYNFAMKIDISNGEYETLSMDKHIDSETGKLYLYKGSLRKALVND